MAAGADYLALIPSANRQQPNFVATVTATVQPFVDIQNVTDTMPAAFDLDLATGVQLDAIGQWIGQSRTLSTPLDIYFALDIAGRGLDAGWLKGPYDPDEGVVDLTDEYYRMLLRGKIAANSWDGTIPDAYRLLAIIFPDYTAVVQDYGNMTMLVGLVGASPDLVTQALFNVGALFVKPAGVRVICWAFSVAPFFGLDADNDVIAGLDSGEFFECGYICTTCCEPIGLWTIETDDLC